MESIIAFLCWVGIAASPGEINMNQYTADQQALIQKQYERYIHLKEKNPNNIDKLKTSFYFVVVDELEL